jgi:hypothetical protein
MAMIEAVKVIAALREAAVLEPIPTVVALNESITITVLEMAALAALGEPRPTPPGPDIAMAAAVMAPLRRNDYGRRRGPSRWEGASSSAPGDCRVG